MGKPIEHAENSVKKFGGDVFDYLDIHELLDSSQTAFADFRHRALTHNSWFVFHVIPKMFGSFITIEVNGEDKRVSTAAVAEQHVLEDLGFMPDAVSYLKLMRWESWMDKKTADLYGSFSLPVNDSQVKDLLKITVPYSS